MYKLLLLFVVVSMVACRNAHVPTSVPVQIPQVIAKPRLISLKLVDLKAYNIQENLSIQDELWIEYNLVAIKAGQILRVETASRFLGGVKQNERINLDSIPKLNLLLNPGEQLGVQVSLWELDDYTKDLHLLKQVNQWGGMLQIPMMLVEWSSASNPVSWFLWGARLGSIGLDFWSKQDGRDLLGVSELQWDWVSLPKGKSIRFKRGNWKGGRVGLNAYQYGYSYQIAINE